MPEDNRGIDPVHQDELGWWFWDETWANRFGPYETKEEAEQMMKDYLRWLDNGGR